MLSYVLPPLLVERLLRADLDAEHEHDHQYGSNHTHEAEEELVEALGKEGLGDFLF